MSPKSWELGYTSTTTLPPRRWSTNSLNLLAEMPLGVFSATTCEYLITMGPATALPTRETTMAATTRHRTSDFFISETLLKNVWLLIPYPYIMECYT